MTVSLDNIDVNLDNQILQKGLPIVQATSEYDKYINMSYNELQNIANTKAEDISFILEQCALYIQKTCNRLNAKLLQVENNLHKGLAAVYDTYQTYGGFDIVLQKACAEYPHLEELNQMKIQLKMELTDLNFLSKHITKMADKVSNMKWRNK